MLASNVRAQGQSRFANEKCFMPRAGRSRTHKAAGARRHTPARQA